MSATIQLPLTGEQPAPPPPTDKENDVPRVKDRSQDLRQPSKRHPGDPAPFSMKPNLGTGQCLCMGCGEIFNSVSAFERHQRLAPDGRVICTYPGDITDRDGNPKPMVRNARGLWVLELREMEP